MCISVSFKQLVLVERGFADLIEIVAGRLVLRFPSIIFIARHDFL